MSSFGKQRNHPYRSLLAALIILTVTLAAGSTALAQVPKAPPAGAKPDPGQPLTDTPARSGTVDRREVESFMNEYVPRQLKKKIPGATVSVVEDGKVLFAKGYGQADVSKDVPVVADETLFRIVPLPASSSQRPP